MAEGTWLPDPPPAAPLDIRYGYRNIRYSFNARDQQIANYRSSNSWPHERPFSVLVAVMGAHWKPGCWQRVMDMVQHTNAMGFPTNLEEIMDRCFSPYDALGAMRNESIMRARQGYEYLLYVDGDVMPEPDLLVRLLEHQVPIVAPWVEEPGTGKPLHGPHRQKNTGLQPIRWCVLSMLLFRTNVFNGVGTEFWNNAIGADEGYHFQKLWDLGHSPMLDTGHLLPVYSIPTYPLATNRMTEEDAKSFWDKRREWLLAMPDRRPINPGDPHQEGGEYLPFVTDKAADNATDKGNGWGLVKGTR